MSIVSFVRVVRYTLVKQVLQLKFACVNIVAEHQLETDNFYQNINVPNPIYEVDKNTFFDIIFNCCFFATIWSVLINFIYCTFFYNEIQKYKIEKHISFLFFTYFHFLTNVVELFQSCSILWLLLFESIGGF